MWVVVSGLNVVVVVGERVVTSGVIGAKVVDVSVEGSIKIGRLVVGCCVVVVVVVFVELLLECGVNIFVMYVLKSSRAISQVSGAPTVHSPESLSVSVQKSSGSLES